MSRTDLQAKDPTECVNRPKHFFFFFQFSVHDFLLFCFPLSFLFFYSFTLLLICVVVLFVSSLVVFFVLLNLTFPSSFTQTRFLGFRFVDLNAHGSSSFHGTRLFLLLNLLPFDPHLSSSMLPNPHLLRHRWRCGVVSQLRDCSSSTEFHDCDVGDCVVPPSWFCQVGLGQISE